MEGSQETRSRSTIWPSYPTRVGIYPKTPHQHYYRDGYPSMFIAAQFTVVKLWNQPRCSSREKWLRKMWFVYTMEFFLVHKEDESYVICEKRDTAGDTKPVSERQYVFSRL